VLTYNGIVRVSITEHSQPKGVKPQIRGHILRSSAYWQEVLKNMYSKWGVYTRFGLMFKKIVMLLSM
jgi:hypothetical protein